MLAQRHANGPPKRASNTSSQIKNKTFDWSNFIPLLKQTDREQQILKVLIGIDDGDATWVNATDLDEEVIAICANSFEKYPPFTRRFYFRPYKP